MTAGTLAIGICGLGSIGRRHARLLGERGDVSVHTFDPDPDAALDPGVIVSPTFQHLLATTDGVVIATPDELHGPLTIDACRAGVAVLVEKPVADRTDAARAMAATASDCGVAVLVGHVLRHVAVLQRAAELLSDAAIGTVVSFHATLGAYETLELARSRFAVDRPYRLPFDYCHEWHYLQWLLGDVVRCAAIGHTAGELALRQTPNVVDVLLELANGATGSVHLDYVERDGARTARVVGDRGVLEIDVRAGSLVLHGRGGPTVREEHGAERDEAFRRQLDHFVGIVRDEVEPLVPIGDGLRALAVAEAVVAACEQGTWQDVAP